MHSSFLLFFYAFSITVIFTPLSLSLCIYVSISIFLCFFLSFFSVICSLFYVHLLLTHSVSRFLLTSFLSLFLIFYLSFFLQSLSLSLFLINPNSLKEYEYFSFSFIKRHVKYLRGKIYSQNIKN